MPSPPSTQWAGEGLVELVGEQREVGAGEDHRVHPFGAGLGEQGPGGAADFVTETRVSGELGLGQIDQLGRAVADDGAMAREPGGEIVDIGLADRRLGAEHSDDPGSGGLGGRLDRRDGADDRKVERDADLVEGDRAGGVAGDDDQARLEALGEAPEKRRHPRGDLGLASGSVG
jgi:hypothetical protein